MKLSLVVLLVLCFTGSAFGETLEKLLEQLRSEVRTEVQATREKISKDPADAKGSGEEGMRAHRLETALNEIFLPDRRTGRTNGGLALAAAKLRESTKSEKVGSLAKIVIDEANRQETEASKAFVDLYTKTMRAAGEALLKATTGADLDGPIRDIADFKQEAREFQATGRLEKQVDIAQVDTMRQLLVNWQNVLVEGATPGRKRDAMTKLDNLGVLENDFISRSAFLERVAAMRAKLEPVPPKQPNPAEVEASLREILRGIKKVEEFPAAFEKAESAMGVLREGNSYMASNGYAILTSLRLLRRQYDEFQNGITPLNFGFGLENSNSACAELNALRALILQFGAPRLLGLSGELAPTANEQLLPYLRRISDHARQQKDWELMRKILDFATALNMTAVAQPADVTAVRQMLVGLNMEKARQPADAVNAFLRSLRTGSQIIPAEWIGEKLEKIKASSPKDYDLGRQNAEKPDQVIKVPASALGLSVSGSGY